MKVIPRKKSLGESIEWIKCDQETIKNLSKQDKVIERMLIDLGEDFLNRGK